MPPPLPPTPLIGRQAEIAAAELRLREHGTRLLTLIGPPGVGKTRLALALAQRRVEHDPDGVAFVALESVSDAALVPAALARVLGLRETPGQTLTASLHHVLRARRMLIVLDNFEHLLAAADSVGELLSLCPFVQVIVTSRAALRLRAETLLPVEPLALPPATHDAEELSAAAIRAIEDTDAVRLFLARAQAVRAELVLTPATAPQIATICARLDGLPLALELAAARSRLYSPRELAERLGARLALLTGGGPDLPPRQRTLRAAITWSYELLTKDEQRLLRLLSVFPGGATFDAMVFAAQAEGDETATALEPLDQLIGHSLVQRREDADGTSRLRMLETIHEFAAEQLAAAGEEQAARHNAAAWYLALLQFAVPALNGPDQTDWLARLDAEHDNLRGVLGWTLASGRAALGLEIAGALWRFWLARGYLNEGSGWLTRLLAADPRAPGLLRAAALHGAGLIAIEQGNLAGAADFGEASLALFREAGHADGAEALNLLGRVALRRSHYAEGTRYAEEGLALARAAGNDRLVAQSLNLLGTIAIDEGQFARARELHEQALAVAEAHGEQRIVAAILNNLGLITHRLDDYPSARRFTEQALVLNRRLGNPIEMSRNLTQLTMIVRGMGNQGEARAFAEEALKLARANGSQMGVASALSQLTAIARAQGDLEAAQRFSTEHLETARTTGSPIQRLAAVTEAAFNAQAAGLPARAVRLLAASEAMREAIGLAQHEGMRRLLEERLSELHEQLAADAFARAWAGGTTMTADIAIAHALAAPAPASAMAAPTSPASPAVLAGLTRRQIEILALLAAGESNAAIATRLVLSERTVENHIAHIYARIGVGGRAEAAAYAVRHGLAG